MKTHYTIHYNGNATRFKQNKFTVFANSEREAVETVYSNVMPENYFPDATGFIRDCDGQIIAAPDSDTIQYDGGDFYALVTGLLLTPHDIPKNIADILEEYNDAETYSELSELQQKLEAEGYTIDFDMGCTVYNWRPLH